MFIGLIKMEKYVLNLTEVVLLKLKAFLIVHDLCLDLRKINISIICQKLVNNTRI